MRCINKQKDVENIFLDNGFTNDEFVVGTGKTFAKKDNNNRFVFDAKNRNAVLNKTAKYAVKYFSDYDFYIVWETTKNSTPKRTSFRTIYSVIASDILSAYEKNLNAQKGVEFEWRLKEDVIVTNYENLKILVSNFSKKRNE